MPAQVLESLWRMKFRAEGVFHMLPECKQQQEFPEFPDTQQASGKKRSIVLYLAECSH